MVEILARVEMSGALLTLEGLCSARQTALGITFHQYGTATRVTRHSYQEIEMQIRRLIFVILLLQVLSSGVNFAHSARTETVDDEFLSQTYLQDLKRTRSPLAAEGGRSVNDVVVRKKEGVTEVVAIINFHEGGPSFIVDRSGKAVLSDSAGYSVGKYFVQIVDDGKLRLGFGDFPTETYIAVRNLQVIVRGASVAGTYLDDQLRRYTFTEDGVATNPDGTFRFTIGVDHVPYHFDYIERDDDHKILKFVRNKCQLDIYEVTDAVENKLANAGNRSKRWSILSGVGCKEIA
jgi:hypothetical protein